MTRIKLDNLTCITAQCQPGKARTDYYDLLIIGFTLEVRSSGNKTYAFRYQDKYGKLKQRRIARFGDISFGEAQKIAKRWRAEVIMGGDPAADKAAKREVPTYADLAEQHLDYARRHLRRPENVERVVRVHLLPRFGRQRADAITTQEVAKYLAEKRKAGLAPATVEKLKVTFGRSFQLAIRAGTAGVKFNPVQGIPREKFNNAKDRFLTAEEAARLLQAAEQSRNPQLKNIIGLLLTTGCRRGEILGARWENVDLEGRSLFLPMTKNGTSRFVPLS